MTLIQSPNHLTDRDIATVKTSTKHLPAWRYIELKTINTKSMNIDKLNGK